LLVCQKNYGSIRKG